MNLDGSFTGPTVTGAGQITVTPMVTARLAFLFYDVAGPFVELTPYVPITISASGGAAGAHALIIEYHGTWSIALKFKVDAGCTFAGWLEWLLGLSDKSYTLYDGTIHSWSGSW
jgi:hypothetical protein